MKPYKYLSLLFLPFLAIFGYYLGGWWNLLTPVLCFLVNPFLSMILRKTAGKKIKEEKYIQANPLHFRIAALLFVPVLISLFTWALIKMQSMEAREWIFFAISIGTINGVIGFPLAHEFIHRYQQPEKTCGIILLLLNNYCFYKIEHISGHHVYAGTYRDPNTARKDESYYHFFARSVTGTYITAWKIEVERLKKRHVPFLNFKNRMLCFNLLQIVTLIGLFLLSGTKGVLFFLTQSFVAIALLQLIDYIQHYGLVRKEIAAGKYEKINELHSWESGFPQRVFNLFQLEKHADHHLHPAQKYERLVCHHQSPKLPGGYNEMICLAMLPPLWFRIINKRIPSITKRKYHETNL